MSVSQSIPAGGAVLRGQAGNLILAQIRVEPYDLEFLLECLSSLPFPVNPQIVHGMPTLVEFPVWQNDLAAVADALSAFHFPPTQLTSRDMLSVLAG